MNSKVTYLLYGVCFGLCLVNILLLLDSPTKGYELSIYQSTPNIVWVLFCINYIICLSLIIKDTIKQPQNKSWVLGVGILVLNGIIVLLIPVLRDYYAIGSDTLMHIGSIKDLSHLIRNHMNIYPMLHVFPTILVWLGVSPELSAHLSPVFWYLIYIISFYYLVKLIFTDKRTIIVAVVLSTFLYIPQGIGITGTLIGACTLPIILIVIIKLSKNFNWKWVVALIGLMWFISILHPLALEVLCIALVLSVFILKQNRWKIALLTIFSIGFAVFWYAYWYEINIVLVIINDVFKSSFIDNHPLSQSIYTAPIEAIPAETSMADIIKTDTMSNFFSGIQNTQLIGNNNPIVLIIKRYISEIVISGLSIFGIVIVIKDYIKNYNIDRVLIYLGILFIILNLMWVAGWYLHLGSYDMVLSRMMYWVMPLAIIFASILIVRLLQYKRKFVYAIATLIICVACYSVFNLYPSPFTGVPNTQTTHQQIKGIKWIVENGDKNVPVYHFNYNRLSRYCCSIYGMQWIYENQRYYWRLSEINNSFNYNEYSKLGDVYKKPIYMVITKLDRYLPRWDIDKLYLIEKDPSASLIYKDSDEIEIWYIGKE